MCDVRSTTVQQPDRVPLLWILVSLWHILSDRCAMCVICVKLTTELFKRWPVVRFAARNPDCLSVRTKPKVRTRPRLPVSAHETQSPNCLEQNDGFPSTGGGERSEEV